MYFTTLVRTEPNVSLPLGVSHHINGSYNGISNISIAPLWFAFWVKLIITDNYFLVNLNRPSPVTTIVGSIWFIITWSVIIFWYTWHIPECGRAVKKVVEQRSSPSIDRWVKVNLHNPSWTIWWTCVDPIHGLWQWLSHARKVYSLAFAEPRDNLLPFFGMIPLFFALEIQVCHTSVHVKIVVW